MNKNFIIAMILSVAVMFIWSEFFAPKPDPEAIKKQQEQTEQTEQAEKTAEDAPKNIIVTEKPVANVETAQLTADKTNPEKTGSIANGALELTFSTLEGKVTKSLITEERYIRSSRKMWLKSLPSRKTLFTRSRKKSATTLKMPISPQRLTAG